MKCVRCNRPLTTAAETVGIYAYGPKCAKRAGLIRHKERTRKSRPAAHRVDKRQVDWVNEVRA